MFFHAVPLPAEKEALFRPAAVQEEAGVLIPIVSIPSVCPAKTAYPVVFAISTKFYPVSRGNPGTEG